jgi:hypothetical protein
MPMGRKTILTRQQDYEDNPDCQNCPYFINKLVCPFHREKQLKGVNGINQVQVKARTSDG